jgi:hypothetical protein
VAELLSAYGFINAGFRHLEQRCCFVRIEQLQWLRAVPWRREQLRQFSQ